MKCKGIEEAMVGGAHAAILAVRAEMPIAHTAYCAASAPPIGQRSVFWPATTARWRESGEYGSRYVLEK
ncbi:MAG: hypothetical protein ACRECH_12615 [Nitrososphaerales archaeon]